MQWTKQMRDLVLAVYGLTLIMGLPANLLAFYVFVRKVKQNAKPIDVLLLNLNISDLVFLFFLPFRLKEAAEMKWTMSYFLCSMSVFVFFTGICNSILLLTAISVERYLGVAFPVKYKLKRRPCNAVIASAIFWVFSVIHGATVFIVQYYNPTNNTSHDQPKKDACYADFSKEQMPVVMHLRLELFLVFCCIPFIICCFCYINLILILSRLPNINPKRRSRAIGLAVGTLLVFVVCFVPFSTTHLVGYIGWYSPSWRVYALLTSTFNACLDPFIFYFSSSALRQTFKVCARGLIKRMSCCSGATCCPQLNVSNVEENTQRSNNSFR
ncbi:free fatty acid receptor 3-like [Salminus brasiliensis]|uniref:free fatty acid receptor 3-like n=1 Tax=Salminus brasiliensis TaxID=930266 RepID=UPI003B833706